MASAPTLLGPSRVGCRYASAPTRLVHFVSGCGLNAKVDPCASLLALRLCDPCLLLGWVSLVASGVFGGEYAGVNTRAGSTDGFSLFRRLDATDAGSSTALRPSPYGMRSVSKRWLLSTNPKEMGSLYLLGAALRLPPRSSRFAAFVGFSSDSACPAYSGGGCSALDDF